MCYHESYDLTDSDDQPNNAGADTKLVYETLLTAPTGDTSTLSVAAEPEGDGWRVVLTPDADQGSPKTFQVDAARDHDDVRAFVSEVVKAFARPFEPGTLDELAFHAGYGSSALTAVCRRHEARDLTEY
jgi:DsbC/DsbD-like thiol-disulfide interchange protein